MSLPNLPDVPRERRRTATVIAVSVFAVLCVLGLVLGLKGLFAPPSGATEAATTAASGSAAQGGGTAPGATGSGASATSATPAGSATDQPAADVLRFTSPSRNIRCEISSNGARCDLAARSWQLPAKPADCQEQWGQGLAVDSRHSFVVCAADSLAPTGDPLAYGSYVSRGEFRCGSSKDGVQCLHVPTSHSFSVARASYRLT